MKKAIKLVEAERQRQIVLWGAQAGNTPFEWLGILMEEVGELAQAVNETCLANARFKELGGLANIKKEAVHVAAVAVALIEAIKAEEDGK